MVYIKNIPGLWGFNIIRSLSGTIYPVLVVDTTACDAGAHSFIQQTLSYFNLSTMALDEKDKHSMFFVIQNIYHSPTMSVGFGPWPRSLFLFDIKDTSPLPTCCDILSFILSVSLVNQEFKSHSRLLGYFSYKVETNLAVVFWYADVNLPFVHMITVAAIIYDMMCWLNVRFRGVATLWNKMNRALGHFCAHTG